MTTQPSLISVQKIWDEAEFNAFTDLIFYQGRWMCVFRESNAHQYGSNGSIRIIASADGKTWESLALFREEGVDLRDPKLCETPDGRLMLLMGGTVYDGKTYVTRQPRATFSSDGEQWLPLTLVLEPHEWLWRVTWHQGKAYGVSYRQSDPRRIKRRWIITLFVSDDGVHYSPLKSWPLTHYPNETTLRFLPNGEMVALVRRERKRKAPALIGISKPPYTRWKWESSHLYFGGPNFIVLDDQSMWAGGRVVEGEKEMTVLAAMSFNSLQPVLVLPSGGDTSYPGMVYRNGVLWMSYYSSHEGKTSVYLARIRL